MTVRRLHPEQLSSFAFTPDNLDWAKLYAGRMFAGSVGSDGPRGDLTTLSVIHWLAKAVVHCVTIASAALAAPSVTIVEVQTASASALRTDVNCGMFKYYNREFLYQSQAWHAGLDKAQVAGTSNRISVDKLKEFGVGLREMSDLIYQVEDDVVRTNVVRHQSAMKDILTLAERYQSMKMEVSDRRLIESSLDQLDEYGLRIIRSCEDGLNERLVR